MQSLAQITLDKLFGSCYTVKVGIEVVAVQGSGHLLLTHLRIKHPLAKVPALLITLLIDGNLVDGTTIRQDITSLIFFWGNLFHQLSGVIVLHQLFHGQFFLAVSGNILRGHLLGMKLLSVNLSREEPVFGILVRLVGVSMSHFATIDGNHLWLPMLLLLLLSFLGTLSSLFWRNGFRLGSSLYFLCLLLCFGRFRLDDFLRYLLRNLVHDGNTCTSPDEFRQVSVKRMMGE